MRISIVIPVFNEVQTLPRVWQRVQAAPLPEGCEREVVIVDGGSTDGTRAWLAAVKHPGVHVILSGDDGALPCGKGAAIRAGLAHVQGEIVLIQDADLEYDPDDYLTLLTPLVRGDAEVVYGSRFLGQRGRRELGMSRAAWLANRLLTSAANRLYGARITDEATAYKVFRADVLRGLQLRCRGFEFCPEVTAKLCRRGHRICEVAIRYQARSRAQGKKIRARDGCVALWTLVRYRFSG